MEETDIQELIKSRRQILSGDIQRGYIEIDGRHVAVTEEDSFMVCSRSHAKDKCHLMTNGYVKCVSCQQ